MTSYVNVRHLRAQGELRYHLIGFTMLGSELKCSPLNPSGKIHMNIMRRPLILSHYVISIHENCLKEYLPEKFPLSNQNWLFNKLLRKPRVVQCLKSCWRIGSIGIFKIGIFSVNWYRSRLVNKMVSSYRFARRWHALINVRSLNVFFYSFRAFATFIEYW